MCGGLTSAHCARVLAALLLCAASVATAADGVSVSGGVTAVQQDANRDRARSELSASADLVFSAATDNGDWLLYVEASSSPRQGGVSAFYPTVNGDARSVLTSDGSGGVQISELHYTHRAASGASLTGGLVDVSNWLDLSRIASDENTQFLNGNFVHNPTIEFPDYAIGAILRLPDRGSRPAIKLVLSGSDGIADLPDRSYQDLLDLNAHGRGVFAGAGLTWSGEPGFVEIGGWLRSDRHPVVDRPGDDEWNYGIYASLGRSFGMTAINLRAGVANPDVAVVDGFAAIALQHTTRFGRLGAAIGVSHVAEGFRAGRRARAIDAEVYFRLPLFDGRAYLSPSIQYVEVPHVDVDDAVPGASASVAGVRFDWSF